MTKKTILVVDDDLSILSLMRYRLELWGYVVVKAETGISAIEEVLKSSKGESPPIQLVLLDLGLGSTSGFEILTEIKNIQATLPVIMVTGSHSNEEAAEAIQLGAYDYVTKPVDPNKLLTIMHRWMMPEEAGAEANTARPDDEDR